MCGRIQNQQLNKNQQALHTEWTHAKKAMCIHSTRKKKSIKTTTRHARFVYDEIDKHEKACHEKKKSIKNVIRCIWIKQASTLLARQKTLPTQCD